MTRRTNSVIVTIAFLLAALPVRAEVIDRVVAVVDDKFIITLSDIRKERAIETALGSDPGNDDAVANLLVEKHLLEEQITQFRPAEISESDVADILRTLKTPAGVSDREMKQAVESKLRRLAFVNQRFGQFIRVSDEELTQYYEKTLVPELQRKGERVPALETVADSVRENVIKERMINEFNDWLAELIKRATIEKIPQ